MAGDSSLWYVMINDAETGPLTRVELGVELASGSITSDSLVWKDGMINWLPGKKVPELEALFKNPPRSPRATGARPPPPPKQPQKGAGLSEFDTGHFKLADLQAEDNGESRSMEFDTAHFKLADVQAQKEAEASSRQMEFDTAHFRLQDLKGVQGARAAVPRRIRPGGPAEEPIIPVKQGRSSIKQASTAAATKPAAAPSVAVRSAPAPVPAPAKAARLPPPPVAAKPKAAPKADAAFDPNRTSVDFRTLGELVHQQQVAQSMFETELVPDEAPVEEPAPPTPPPQKSKADLAAELKAKALAKASLPAEGRSWLPTAIAIAGALAMAAFVVWYLLTG